MEKTSKKKYHVFGAVVDAPKENPLNLDYLGSYEKAIHGIGDFSFLATIIHDRDVYSKEDEAEDASRKEGTRKPKHLHVFIETAEDMTTLQVVKMLAQKINATNEQISVRGSENDFLLCQYLIHKNDADKAQYQKDECWTTSLAHLDELMAKEYVRPVSQEERLEQALFQCTSIVDFINAVGAVDARKYLGLFNQVRQENGNKYKDLAREYNRMREDLKAVLNHLKRITDNYSRNTLLERDITEAKAYLDVLEATYDFDREC